ncbi:MAG TPA: phage holin family protein [Candidatus Binatia bacterium]|jgi:putative membrane protein|nr:phage holin family protein [Candidatus Binatia bacterium]
MTRLLLRWIVNAVALWVAIQIVPGLNYISESSLSLLVIALIFGLVNALVRPILVLLTCPLIVLTLGLFVLVINAIMLSITVWLSGIFDLGLTSESFISTLLGALVISLVSGVINLLVHEDQDRERNRDR